MVNPRARASTLGEYYAKTGYLLTLWSPVTVATGGNEGQVQADDWLTLPG